MRRFLIPALVLLLPTSVLAAAMPATFSLGRSVVSASSSPGNAYAGGASIVLTAPVLGDLSAVGGSIVEAGEVGGDALLIGGSVSSRASVGGDLRAIGGSLSVEAPVKGDLAALGFAVSAAHAGGSVFVVAADVKMKDGAKGPVTIYGNEVTLGGAYGSDVHVVSSGHLTLLASTTIAGKLIYQAPEPAAIADSASVKGGVEYTNASYLPNVGTSRVLVYLSLGFFLFARILGALILAGLLAGLSPRFAERITDRLAHGSVRATLLTLLLGLAALIVTPVVCVLLVLTFVGIWLAGLVFLFYCLLFVLAFAYAGITLGSLSARRFGKREAVLWRDGVLGMLALSLIALVPMFGGIIAALLMMFCAGALLTTFFYFIFPQDAETPEML